MRKNLIGLIAIFLIVCIGSYLIYNLRDEEKQKESDITTVSYDKEIDLLDKMGIDKYESDNLVFDNVAVIINEDKDSFNATFVSKNIIDLVNLEIIIYDKEMNELSIVNFEVKDLLEGEERDLFCVVEEDLSRANSFVVNIKND